MRSDLLLERIAQKELPEPLDLSPAERADIENRRRADAAFLRQHPQPPSVPRPKPLPWGYRLGLGLVPLAALLILTINFNLGPEPAVGIKGTGDRLVIFRQTTAGPAVLPAAAEVIQGDVIQVAYAVEKPGHGLVFSLDGAGKLTFHLPLQQPHSTPLTSGGLIYLAQAYTLDNAPDFEKFYLVEATAPFQFTDLAAFFQTPSGQAAPELVLPPAYTVKTFLLKKRSLP